MAGQMGQNGSSMGGGLLNQNSGLNILAARNSVNNFSPAPRRASMNDDIEGGGAFMTEPRASVGRTASRTNVSPDRASAMMQGNAKANNSQADMFQPSPVSMMNSPNASTSQLVSFNFLTQVPIEEFVI